MFDFPNNPPAGTPVTLPDGAVRTWDGQKWKAGRGVISLSAVISDTPPIAPFPGQFWFDSSNPQLYLWYSDPNSSQWVIATANAGGLSADAPVDGNVYGRSNAAWSAINQASLGGPFLPLSPSPITATGSTTSRSMQDRLSEVINVKDYGALGIDGTQNATAAFNAAIAAASATHKKVVWIPAGFYNLDPITIPEGVTLSGNIPGPVDPRQGFLTNAIGATLFINSHATPFITLQRSACLQDVLIYDPGQVAPTATAPNVFPPQVLMADCSRVRGVTLCNAYDGIWVRSGRCFVEDCYIGAYHTCVDTDAVADVVYLINIWCGVFYDTCLGLFPWQNMDNWVINNNGVAFKFGRADGISMINCGSFIKWAGIYIVDGTGTPSGQTYGWCVNHNSDVCVYGAVISSTNAAVGWQFVNFTALPTAGPTNSQPQSVSPLVLQSGGVSAPIVNWTGGAIGVPGSPGYWTTPTPIVNAGALQVSGVSRLTDGVVTPRMDGTAAPGTSLALARADHVHPSDTSRLATSGGTLTGDLLQSNNTWLRFLDASNAPLQFGVGNDNNLYLNGTNATGAGRQIMQMNQHSSSSIMYWMVPVSLFSTVGFNGTAPIAKPTVSGAKGSNAALASLMTALAAYGLITDSTSA